MLSWYRNLCSKQNEVNWSPGPCQMTAKQRTSPYLLRLMSNNKVIHYDVDHWCTLHSSESSTFEKLNHSMNICDENITSPLDTNLNTIRKLCKIIL